ncbi:uncharacterized protein VTP21DRAFT_821 [Calcarisporiella thermophila]|uniref:uncharacterized protein n=1 Tax=Calcarisporiella thermophila TaxID=911321 RepID=UPI0037434C7D
MRLRFLIISSSPRCPLLFFYRCVISFIPQLLPFILSFFISTSSLSVTTTMWALVSHLFLILSILTFLPVILLFTGDFVLFCGVRGISIAKQINKLMHELVNRAMVRATKVCVKGMEQKKRWSVVAVKG